MTNYDWLLVVIGVLILLIIILGLSINQANSWDKDNDSWDK